MKYCTFCGNEINKEATICPYCKKEVLNNNSVSENDAGGFGWGALGFFIPLAGLILFIVWNSEKPKTAKSAGLGALIGTVANVIFIIILYVIFIWVMMEANPNLQI